MRRLTDGTVLAVGRLTLAATELEYVLAGIGADSANRADQANRGDRGDQANRGDRGDLANQADRADRADRADWADGGSLATIFTAPGEPVQAARRHARQAAPEHRTEFVGLVEAAATYLVQSRTAVRALWLDGNRVDAATFDEITGLILRCRDRLQALRDDLDHPSATPPRTR
ncbi:hypothetical protein [Micromonospora sp. NBC_00421]|uniref:hypothetical protein n=1 Tax=Micromonospora sp. NBC_00421 TaxID=2975976 RepID=UPI002E1EACE0